MKLSMDAPVYLLLIPLLAAGILYTGKKIKDRGKKNSILILRMSVAVCLVLALCGLRINWYQDKAVTVFLADLSDSAAAHKNEAGTFIIEAMKFMPDKEQAGVAAFGGDTRIEQFISGKRQFSDFETQPSSTATNLEKGIQAVMGLYTGDAHKRLVILTDGQENEGSILKMAPVLKKNNVEVQIAGFKDTAAGEVYLDKVRVLDRISVGDTFQVEVTVESNVKTAAVLYLYSGTELKASEKVELSTGSSRYVFKDTLTAPGLNSYRVLIEPEQDTRSVNNEYAVFTRAEDKEKILLIEGSSGQADEYVKVLDAAGIIYDRVLPDGAPRTLTVLNRYKVIISLDVYRDDLPAGFLDNIESYVRDFGGGYAAIGGENSFALGNYKDSPLEEILPVYMDLRGEKEIPKMAMVMVIDRSGSMSAGNGYVTLLDLAKQAALKAVGNLRPIDDAGVLSFESSYSWTVPLSSAENSAEIEEAVSGIALGGGTSIYPAVREAYESLKDNDAKRKHILLLTDGEDGFRDYDELLKEMGEDNITLSTVAVGEGSDGQLLSGLAKKGGGRYYYTDINTDIPRIFAQEVFLSARSYLVNRSFIPEAAGSSKIMKGVALSGLPVMDGYVASTKKEMASAHLVSDQGDPILTTWQYGLGRTAAFNSDGENRWTAAYAGWDDYPLFWKNIIDWLTTDTAGGDNNVSIKQEGTRARIEYRTETYTGDTAVYAVYSNESGGREEVLLKPSEPGTFSAEVPTEHTGIYDINIRQEEKGQIVSSLNTAMAVQYSPEYRFMDESTVLKEFADAVDARYIDNPEDVFSLETERVKSFLSMTNALLLLAILLFMLDIANRRLKWRFKVIRIDKSPRAGRTREGKGGQYSAGMLDMGELLNKRDSRKN